MVFFVLEILQKTVAKKPCRARADPTEANGQHYCLDVAFSRIRNCRPGAGALKFTITKLSVRGINILVYVDQLDVFARHRSRKRLLVKFCDWSKTGPGMKVACKCINVRDVWAVSQSWASASGVDTLPRSGFYNGRPYLSIPFDLIRI